MSDNKNKLNLEMEEQKTEAIDKVGKLELDDLAKITGGDDVIVVIGDSGGSSGGSLPPQSRMNQTCGDPCIPKLF